MIKTPDQRLRVFVSSTMQELAAEREAIKKAILELHLIPVLFELGARPHPPRDLYTAYLQQSHLFIGVYWQQYGWVGPGMTVSGIEDEFNLSRNMPRLIYIKEPAPERAEGLKKMIGAIQNANVSYKTFASPDDLHTLVQNDLAILLTERFEQSGGTRVKRLNTDELNQQMSIPPTVLIGREKVVQEIIGMLEHEDYHLVTVTGIGGIGKTRVALEVARQLKSKNTMQVCFVPLDSIEHAEDVPAAILRKAFPEAQATGSPLQLLAQLLTEKKAVLVLDNFEQIIEAHFVISELLQHCPQLKILITSREVLRISGETEYALRPLELYQSTNTTQVPAFEDLSPAVQLFVTHARLFRHNFQLTPGNYGTVVRICHTLDGIPLAIELAAARMQLFSPAQLLPRLEKRFDLLKTSKHDAPARHQTLKAMIDWSFNLLSPEEQRLFCLLSVFSGGGSLDAVDAVASDHGVFKNIWSCPRQSFYNTDPVNVDFCAGTDNTDTLELLESLLVKSLAHTSVNKYGTLRINFYQTILQYCRERLPEFGLEKEAYHRHLIYFLYLAESNWANLKGENATKVYELFDNDIDNMTAALDWSVTHEPLTGLRLAVALAEYWDTRGKSDEVLKWMKALIDAVENNNQNFRILAIAKTEMARALFRVARYEEGWVLATQCAEAARERNERHLLADALGMQCFMNIYALRNENKDAILAEGLALARELDYKMMLLAFTQLAASDKINSGMLQESIELSEQSIRIAVELKAKRWEAINYTLLGFAHTWTGNPAQGEADFRRCLECSAFVNDQMLPVYGLLGCVQTSMLTGQTIRALKLLGTVQAFAKRPGTVIPSMTMKIMQAVTEQLNQVPAEQREPALNEGRNMHLDEAVQMVLKPEMSVAAG